MAYPEARYYNQHGHTLIGEVCLWVFVPAILDCVGFSFKKRGTPPSTPLPPPHLQGFYEIASVIMMIMMMIMPWFWHVASPTARAVCWKQHFIHRAILLSAAFGTFHIQEPSQIFIYLEPPAEPCPERSKTCRNSIDLFGMFSLHLGSPQVLPSSTKYFNSIPTLPPTQDLPISNSFKNCPPKNTIFTVLQSCHHYPEILGKYGRSGSYN